MTHRLKTFIVILLFLCLSSYGYAPDNIRVDEKSFLFSPLDKTVPIVTLSYIGWAKKWKWADIQLHPLYRQGASRASFTGRVPDLGIDFTGTLTALSVLSRCEVLNSSSPMALPPDSGAPIFRPLPCSGPAMTISRNIPGA